MICLRKARLVFSLACSWPHKETCLHSSSLHCGRLPTRATPSKPSYFYEISTAARARYGACSIRGSIRATRSETILTAKPNSFVIARRCQRPTVSADGPLLSATSWLPSTTSCLILKDLISCLRSSTDFSAKNSSFLALEVNVLVFDLCHN